jgi:hypothetical protein
MLAAKAAPDAYSKDRPFWRQQMNVESILTGIFTGVFTGVITAFFGLLFALKQFKAQRAFDRQLEWYERTIRALGRFTQDWEQLALLEKHDVRVGDKRATVAQKDILATLVELKACMFESMLYGDQKSYEQLQRLNEKSESRIADHLAPKADTTAAPKADTTPFISLVQEVALQISKPTRKMLGLKDIRLLNPKF